jgi:hypothetical protein
VREAVTEVVLMGIDEMGRVATVPTLARLRISSSSPPLGVERGGGGPGSRAGCGRQNVHHLGDVDAYSSYIISSRDSSGWFQIMLSL